jgi:Fe-S-cluster containining protein
MQQTLDQELIHIVDAATAEAVRRGGSWVACRPGCHECCIGAFPITQADVLRLQHGMKSIDPGQAARIRERARAAVAANQYDFPGDPRTGILGSDDDSEARFEHFANEDPCPALDPATGTCDLYAWRPITCRTFGPALRMNEDSIDTCELCYQGATDDQITACQVDLEVAEREAELEEKSEEVTRQKGETTVAYALALTS